MKCMKFLLLPPFRLHYAFIVIIVIVITLNLVFHEFVILMGENGYVHIMFEIRSLNSNSSALRGHLVCVCSYF